MKNNNFIATVATTENELSIRIQSKPLTATNENGEVTILEDQPEPIFCIISRNMKEKTFFHENSAMSLKDRQYVLNIAKFIREYTATEMSAKLSWKVRMEKIAKTINELPSANTFRNLSTNLRKAYDNGTEAFWNSFFYEGQRRKFEAKTVTPEVKIEETIPEEIAA